LLPAGAVAGWDFHPLESAALSRRTPETDLATSSTRIADVIAAKLVVDRQIEHREVATAPFDLELMRRFIPDSVAKHLGAP